MNERTEQAITQEFLKHLLEYHPDTGEFIWLNPILSPYMNGKVAGRINSCGYREISIKKKQYKAHRLAWLYMTGSFPNDFLAHIDGKRDNNAWGNLREATMSQNLQNLKGPLCTNKTGYLGVSKKGLTDRFIAQIKTNGKKIHLGYFDTAIEAHEAYLKAKREFHEHCTI